MPTIYTAITTPEHRDFLRILFDLAKATTIPDASLEMRRAALEFEAEFDARLKESPAFDQTTNDAQ
jgi:hypothetical protein